MRTPSPRLATVAGLIAIAAAVTPSAKANLIAFDGAVAVAPTPDYVTTSQNSIWNAATVGGGGVVTGVGPDVTGAVNGFAVQSNSPGNLPVAGSPGDFFLHFAAGVGNATTARGTVYAFDVAPGLYTLDYRASWDPTLGGAVAGREAAANVFLYDTTTPVASLTTDHRVDFNTGGNNAFYGGFTGVDPGNVGSIAGFSLVFDSGVQSSGALSDTTPVISVGADDLVIFRIAGQGWGENNSAARLDLLRLNVIPEPASAVVVISALALALGGARRRIS